MSDVLGYARRHLRVPVAISTLCVLAGIVLALVPTAGATAADGTSSYAQVSSDKGDDGNGGKGSAFDATKTLTRTFANADGSTYDFPSNNFSVNVSQTKDLRGRQRVQVTWSGAQPSGGRAANPYGENGLQQEYPVVIMQCRGTDDATLPLDQQVRPETCWTSSVAQRSQIAKGAQEAAWTEDADASDADRQQLSGVAPYPSTDECPAANADGLYSHLTPFIAKSGKVFDACSATTMPPEASVGAAFPPAELAAFSDENGAGTIQFEVRSDVENESLGCNDKTPCTIEVIPINGLSCATPSDPSTQADDACRRGGNFPPGSSNFVGTAADQAVAPSLWWSASNWKNRVSVPISFGLPPDTCDLLDPRAPTGFYGSELMAQAGLQWSPAYCLNKKRFKFQLNQMSDAAGWNLMQSGGGAAAFVSSPHRRTSSDPVSFAPAGVTGFGIGYNIDRPDNQGEYDSLKLNQRLVAKLMTQSYLGSELARAHPGMANNPLGIMNDPEFQQLNPGLSTTSQEAGATLLSLSIDSDVIQQLTSWIAQDKQAMDFINGKPDPWGMVVNPAYKKIKLPKSEWPQLDTFIPQTNDVCRQNNPTVYLSQIAAPVSTLRKIAEALLDGWPNVQTRCDFDPTTNMYTLGRIARQSYGSRFMLGLVSLGDADRYGLRTAALQTKTGSFVGASNSSMSAAVDLMQPQQPKEKSDKKDDTGKQAKGGKDRGGKNKGDDRSAIAARLASVTAQTVGDLAAKAASTTKVDVTRPYVLDQADVRRSDKAYPGTMVVDTAAKTSELDAADAKKVAEFIKVSTTEGQEPGAGNGELPGGFLPITDQGATKKLFVQAQAAAAAVAEQKPLPTESASPTAKPSPTSVSSAAPTLPPGSVSDLPSSDDVPTAAPPTVEQSASPSSTPVAEPIQMPKTQAVSSDLGNRAVPLLLLLGLIGLALTSAIRWFVAPRGPGR